MLSEHYLYEIEVNCMFSVWIMFSIAKQVTKLRTITPHRDIVEAPCEYAQYCGGCKTQNLLYEAQLRAKEQQVHELIIHVGKFDCRDPEFRNVMQPIVPCELQFHYRNKVSDFITRFMVFVFLVLSLSSISLTLI